MTRLSVSTRWLLVILLVAFLIRLPGVPYGLPLHLYGDEEVNVYSALQMLQLHTFLPVLHPDAFTILYEPPVLAYLYAIAFTPAIALMYAAAHFPPLGAFADSLQLDPSVFWIIARSITVFFSLGSIFLVYKIARALFKTEWALTRRSSC